MGDASDGQGPLPPALSADERDFRASFEQLVDWYRIRQSPALLRAFLPGALVLLPIGSLITALSFANLRGLLPLRGVLTVLGVLVTASGPLWAIFQLLRAIRRDTYVAIRLDGLGVRLDPERDEAIYAWESIREVRFDAAAGVLQIELDSGPQLHIAGAFAELSLPELGQKIRDARRLAVWNRLTPRYTPER